MRQKKENLLRKLVKWMILRVYFYSLLEFQEIYLLNKEFVVGEKFLIWDKIGERKPEQTSAALKEIMKNEISYSRMLLQPRDKIKTEDWKDDID